LLGSTIEPMQGSGQTLGQAGAAEQIQLSELQLRLGTSGTGAADHRKFLTICHCIKSLRRVEGGDNGPCRQPI
jgi:hypothetical protein